MPWANPKSYLIRSIRDAGGTALHWLLLEAVDNSLDWGANEIVCVVDLNTDSISIVDNGSGITKDRIEAPITLGDHKPAAIGGLGRFGVGITAQAIKHGDVLEIETISPDGKGTVFADWAQMLKRGDWFYQDPVWRPTLIDAQTGTTVTITKLLKRIKAKEIERSRDELASRFYPALASGRRIILNGNSISVLTEPLLSDVIQTTLTWEDGRAAKIRAGLLKDPSISGLRRVHVSYLHRVIKPSCGFGCDGYSGIENMFARIELSEHWELTQFKDDLLDADDLEERVAEVLEPILEKCHARSMTLDIEETMEAVNDLLGEIAARPQRKKPRQPPLPKPKPTPVPTPPKTLENGTASPSGPVKRQRPRAKIKIEFPAGKDEAEKHRIGTVDRQGRVHRVIMPREDPEIADMLSERDINKRARAIHRHVSLLYMQRKMSGTLFDDFHLQVSDFIRNTNLRSESGEMAAE